MTILLVTTKRNVPLFKKKYDELLLISDNYDQILESYWKENKFDYIYGLGGGCVVDIAKYLAFKWDCPLTFIPTILSTDAIFTNATAYRQDKTVKYHFTKSPEETLFDDEILSTVDYKYHAAGWGDLLSSLIACYCWKNYNDKQIERLNNTKLKFNQEIYDEVQDYLSKITKPNTKENRLQLFNCLKRSSDIEGIFDFPIHEESAEHFFIYNMENYWPHHYLHGDGLVLGILLMAEIADPELAKYSLKLMKIAGMKGIMPPKATVKTILEDMPQFVLKNNFNYSMVDTQAYQDADFDAIIDKVFQQIEELNRL
jgi:glycerol-1-phosphate dehydrogenase [NAD(P)+]